MEEKIIEPLLDLVDGSSAEELLKFGGRSLNFDDVIMLPAHIDFAVNEVNLSAGCRISRNITLSFPLVSAPDPSVSIGIVSS